MKEPLEITQVNGSGIPQKPDTPTDLPERVPADALELSAERGNLEVMGGAPEDLALRQIDERYGGVLEMKQQLPVMKASAENTAVRLESVKRELGMAVQSQSGSILSRSFAEAVQELADAEQALLILEREYLLLPKEEPDEKKGFFGKLMDFASALMDEMEKIMEHSKGEIVEARQKLVEVYILKVTESLIVQFEPQLKQSANRERAEELLRLKIRQSMLHSAGTYISTGENVEAISGAVSFELDRFGDGDSSKYYVRDIKMLTGGEAKQVEFPSATRQIGDGESAPRQIGMGESIASPNESAE